MGLFIFKWLKKRWSILKSEKDFYYSMIGDRLGLTVLIIGFFLFGVIGSVLTGNLQNFDLEMQIKPILSWIIVFTYQICFLIVIDFIVGVEIRQHHFKRTEERRLRKIFPLTFDMFLIFFGLGILFDATFITLLSGNRYDILNSIIIKMLFAGLYGISTFFAIDSYFDLILKMEHDREKLTLENKLISISNRAANLSSIDVKEKTNLLTELENLKLEFSQYKEKYIPNIKEDLDS